MSWPQSAMAPILSGADSPSQVPFDPMIDIVASIRYDSHIGLDSTKSGCACIWACKQEFRKSFHQWQSLRLNLALLYMLVQRPHDQREFLSLMGHLAHAAKVVPPRRTFMLDVTHLKTHLKEANLLVLNPSLPILSACLNWMLYVSNCCAACTIKMRRNLLRCFATSIPA